MGQGPSVAALIGAARDQIIAVAKLPVVAVEAVEELRDAARTMRQVAERVDGVLDEVEGPVRALAPTLARLADLLADPMVAEAPETLARLRDEVLPAIRSLRETQQRVAAIATSTDRITALIDETGGRLAALPSAAALLMRRTGRPAGTEPGAAIPMPPASPPARPMPPASPPPG
ncbi:MAG: hypothetical protein ACJ74O_11545 [Frankiaceae bacterium]